MTPLPGLSEWQAIRHGKAPARAALLRFEDELLFAADPRREGAIFADPMLEMLRADWPVVTRLPAAVQQRLFAGSGGAAHHDGLRRGDILYAVRDTSGRLLHHSFVQFAVRSKILLGEPEAVPLIGRCATDPSARGQRLYPRTLRHIMAELAAAGHHRVVIYCDRDNEASIRGIRHAGFAPVCRLRSVMLLDRWCVQHRSPPGGIRLISY